MTRFGYGNVTDRAFVAFDPELEQGAWKDIMTKKHEGPAKESAAALLAAPPPVVWKLRLRSAISMVLDAAGAPSLTQLDAAWDAVQRRLFHVIGAGVDDEDRGVREAADRLRAQLLSGTGTAQTQFEYDDEVDFGRKQIALTQPGGPLAADAKKVKVESVLADVKKTTEALAQGLGRASGEKRRTPSRQLREAVGECVSAFNSVHEELSWFVRRTPKGADRDRLTALLAPLEALLERNAPDAPADEAPAEAPAAPAPAAPHETALAAPAPPEVKPA